MKRIRRRGRGCWRGWGGQRGGLSARALSARPNTTADPQTGFRAVGGARPRAQPGARQGGFSQPGGGTVYMAAAEMTSPNTRVLLNLVTSWMPSPIGTALIDWGLLVNQAPMQN